MHRIILEEINVRIRIGVTDAERKRRQKVSVSIELYPAIEPEAIDDAIDNTVNYSSVRQDVIRILEKSAFKLIETASRQVAEYIRTHYKLKLVRVTLSKYPYRDTKAVSYTIEI